MASTRPFRLQFDSLEARDVPATITVLVSDPSRDLSTHEWIEDSARAIGRRTGQPISPAQVAQATAEYNSETGEFRAPAVPHGQFVLLDWNGSSTATAGTKLAEYLKTLLPTDGSKLDFHFIGSRAGALVNLKAIKELAIDDAKIDRLQMTTLGVQVLPTDEYRPETIDIPYNVDWADNYHVPDDQKPDLKFGPQHIGVEVDLSDVLNGYTSRSVSFFPPGSTGYFVAHDWYRWTIDRGEQHPNLFELSVDLDNDGVNDDVTNGKNIGYDLSIQRLFAKPTGNYTSVDLALVIDTTGSMGDDIEGVKTRAIEILQTLAQTPGARIGVVLYRDFDDGSHGSPGDFQSSIVLPFTTDFAAAEAAIRAIEVGGGADWPESVYAGLTSAVEAGELLGEWRGDGVRKSIILMGDAPPQRLEPNSNDTKTSTLIRTARADVDVTSVATTAGQEAWWMFKSFRDLTGGEFYYTGQEIAPGGQWDDPNVGYPRIGHGGVGRPFILGGIPAAPTMIDSTYASSGAFITGGGGGDSASAAAGDSVLDAVRRITASIGTSGSDGDRNPVPLPKPVEVDFNADGVQDRVTISPLGSPATVSIEDGKTGEMLFTTQPFGSDFTGVVIPVVGDVNGDGTPDLLVTAGNGGGARVRAYDGESYESILDFLGLDDSEFRGGANVATGDINGDGRMDLIVTAGNGGGPRVTIWDGKKLMADGPSGAQIANFFAFEPELRNGATVAVGDVDGDGYDELTFGAGPGGAPRVRVIDGKTFWNLSSSFTSLDQVADKPGLQVANFFAGDAEARDGVRVTMTDFDDDGYMDLIAGHTEDRRYAAKDLSTTEWRMDSLESVE
ncbi:MAG: FG-GAP-like repeat-containing protein [Fimbriiglobus sp.]